MKYRSQSLVGFTLLLCSGFIWPSTIPVETVNVPGLPYRLVIRDSEKSGRHDDMHQLTTGRTHVKAISRVVAEVTAFRSPGKVSLLMLFYGRGMLLGAKKQCFYVDSEDAAVNIGAMLKAAPQGTGNAVLVLSEASDERQGVGWRAVVSGLGARPIPGPNALVPSLEQSIWYEKLWKGDLGFNELAGCDCSKCTTDAKSICGEGNVGSVSCVGSGTCCKCCITCGTVPPSDCSCGGGAGGSQ